MMTQLSQPPLVGDSPLARAADVFLARLAKVGPAGAEELLADFPDHADDLRRLLPAILTLAAFGQEGTVEGATSSGVAGRALGDFQLLREIGRGGMGVVYEAVQLSLGRRVALKILPLAAVLDPRQLQRFKNEATAAAQLDHPNIVEVYGVGCERGVHFYAMRLVEGVTLAEVVAERRGDRGQGTGARGQRQVEVEAERNVASGRSLALDSSPQPPACRLQPASHSSFAADTARAFLDTTARHQPDFFRLVSQLGIQAAEALDHAHRTGVIHRDIKPSNLMLDASGKLWITDFGLARIGADAPLTMTGDMLGTLRYMSPEQAAGRPTMIDHRTDIYSLGATLYELATDRPAVTGQERAQILREVAEQDPAHPRTLNSAVPVDLETILLKCLAKEPSARYDSAQALADDLRRFLEHRPVVAKRPGIVDAARLWTRRHRVVVNAIALMAIVLAVSATTSLILISRAYHEKAIEAQRATEQGARARRAVDDMYTRFARNWLRRKARMTPVELEFLEKSLAYYEEEALAVPADREARQGIAKALINIAEVRVRMGRSADAFDAIQRAIAGLDALYEEHPDSHAHLKQLVYALNVSGGIQAELKRPDAAERDLSRAADLADALVKESPEDHGLRGTLATIEQNLGSLYFHTGRLPAARVRLETAASLYRELSHAAPEDEFNVEGLGYALINLGMCQHGVGDLASAAVAFDEALSVLQQRGPREVASPETRKLLAGALYESAWMLYPARIRRDEAIARLERAAAIEESLTADFPQVPEYEKTLSQTRALLGRFTVDLAPKRDDAAPPH